LIRAIQLDRSGDFVGCFHAFDGGAALGSVPNRLFRDVCTLSSRYVVCQFDINNNNNNKPSEFCALVLDVRPTQTATLPAGQVLAADWEARLAHIAASTASPQPVGQIVNDCHQSQTNK
jgi:hypothetical protein